MPPQKVEKIDKRSQPGYLLFTGFEELIDDGLEFYGNDEREKLLNQNDFVVIRAIASKYGSQAPPAGLTQEEVRTLRRCCENCVNINRPESGE